MENLKLKEDYNPQSEIDSVFARAVAEKNYSLVTQILNEQSIDANELIDPRKRFYPDYNANIRPLRKLALASEIRHQANALNLRSHVVHEDSSTALMPNFTESVEFPKRSIENGVRMPIWRIQEKLVVTNQNYALNWSIALNDDENREQTITLNTILNEAIIKGEEDLVDAILASSTTNPNQKSEIGLTPLHFAAVCNNLHITQMLLKRGADPTLTWNGFTPSAFAKLPAIKTLFPDEPLLSWSQSELNDNPRQYLNFNGLGQSQFGVLSKMRALRESSEVMFGDYNGVCNGIADIALLFILSNKRNEKNHILGLTRLSEILRSMNILSIEDFMQKMHARERERLEIYKSFCSEIQSNAAESIGEVTSAVNFQKKIEQQMASQFTSEMSTELGFREFLEGVELLQSFYSHLELSREDVRYVPSKEKDINFDIKLGLANRGIDNIILPSLLPEELNQLGGLSTSIIHTGVFLQNNAQEKNETLIYFSLMRDALAHLAFPVSIRISANRHAITIFFDPVCHGWIFVDINQSKYGINTPVIITTKDNNELAKLTCNALKFGHVGTNNFSNAFIIPCIEIQTAKLYESELIKCMCLVEKNPAFKCLFDPTPKKITLKDNYGKDWLDIAASYGQVDTVKKLHQSAFKDHHDLRLYVACAEMIQEISERCVNYYATNNLTKLFGHRNKIFNLVYKISRKIKQEHVLNGTIPHTQCQFLLEILQKRPIAHNSVEDDSNIILSILECYAAWRYQGLDVQTLFSSASSITNDLLTKMISGYPDFISNLNSIFKEDEAELTHIIETLHGLEKTALNEFSKAYYTDLLIKASQKACQNAMLAIPGGVLHLVISEDQLLPQKIDEILVGQVSNETIPPLCHLINTIEEYNQIKPMLTLESGMIFYQALKEKIPGITQLGLERVDAVKTADDFSKEIKALSLEFRSNFYEALKDRLPDLVKNIEDLRIIKVLTPEAGELLYAKVRHRLPMMMRYKYDLNNAILDCPADFRDKIFNDALQYLMSNIKSIYNKERLEAFAKALLNNDFENSNNIEDVKTEFNRLLEFESHHNNRGPQFFHAVSVASKEWHMDLINELCDLKPIWLGKILTALELDAQAFFDKEDQKTALQHYINHHIELTKDIPILPEDLDFLLT